jgi:hypothetical protein
MVHRAQIKFVCLGTVAAAALGFAGCDSGAANGTGGAGASGTTNTATSSGTTSPAGTTSSGTTNPAGTSTSSGATTAASSSGSTAGGIQCGTGNYCPPTTGAGDGGYAFAYADSMNPAPQAEGTSTATLASDNTLCISGQVGLVSMLNGMPDYTDDWGCGLGVNLNQAMATTATSPPVMPYTFTGTGITVQTNGIPSCTTARVVVSNGTTDYCATLTDTTGEIPWSDFNTECYNPSAGTALSGPPTSDAIKVQLVTSGSMTGPCTFTNFCITSLTAK